MPAAGAAGYSFAMQFSRLRYRISHAGFCVAFPLALFVACNAVNLDKLAKWFRAGDALDLSALSAYLVTGLALFTFIFTLLAHRYSVKPVAILLTIVSAAGTYFIAKYGVAIDSSMIRNAVHTDSTEVGQLLSPGMVPYAFFLVVLPVLAILAADIRFEASGRYLLGSLKVIGISLCVAFASLYLEYQAIFRAGNVSNKNIVYTLVPIKLISGSVNVASKA